MIGTPVLALLILLSPGTIASDWSCCGPCVCGPCGEPTAEGLFKSSSELFYGTVVELKLTPCCSQIGELRAQGRADVTFAVSRRWKGTDLKRLTVRTQPCTEIYPFLVGHNYLVSAASAFEGEPAVVSDCARLLEGAAAYPMMRELDQLNETQRRTTVALLQARHPGFVWYEDSSTPVDINADGLQDTAILGHAEGRVAVALVLGPLSLESRAFPLAFSTDGNAQLGICGRPTGLRPRPTSEAPMNALGKAPEGYRVCPSCFEVEVIGGSCDPLVIFWNHQAGSLDWWRP